MTQWTTASVAPRATAILAIQGSPITKRPARARESFGTRRACGEIRELPRVHRSVAWCTAWGPGHRDGEGTGYGKLVVNRWENEGQYIRYWFLSNFGLIKFKIIMLIWFDFWICLHRVSLKQLFDPCCAQSPTATGNKAGHCSSEVRLMAHQHDFYQNCHVYNWFIDSWSTAHKTI